MKVFEIFSVTPLNLSMCRTVLTSFLIFNLERFEVEMWRIELQEVKEEFHLIQFRLMYSNSGDFAESPVSAMFIDFEYQ